jgi:nucleoside-diphosphate-sugar epimerase
MRVLLTGASGFVGRATIPGLVRRGAEVHAVSRRKLDRKEVKQWHRADLLEPGTAAAIVRQIRPDVILHLAWMVEHGSFWTSPLNLDWIAASLALARAGADAGVKRIVGVGTCFEYEFPANGDCDEEGTPLRPTTLYGVAKDATRRVLQAFSSEADLSFAWGRLFYLYGPGEAPERLVASVARALAAGKPAPCASGRPVRDFMDVRDAGEALAALALSGVTGAPGSIGTARCDS